MESFKVTRVFADDLGESHFEKLIYPLKDGEPIGFLPENIKVKDLIFRKVLPAYDDLHNASGLTPKSFLTERS